MLLCGILFWHVLKKHLILTFNYAIRHSEGIFCAKLYAVRRWNKEKNVYMNLKMGKRLKQPKKVCCTGIILKNFFYGKKENLILIQCYSVFMEGIRGISAIEKALWGYFTHFILMFHFHTLWNHHRARSFLLTFSLDMEMEHWREMG